MLPMRLKLIDQFAVPVNVHRWIVASTTRRTARRTADGAHRQNRTFRVSVSTVEAGRYAAIPRGCMRGPGCRIRVPELRRLVGCGKPRVAPLLLRLRRDQPRACAGVRLSPVRQLR